MDRLDTPLLEFKAILAEERGKRGRDYVRSKPQGFLLDALDAGRSDTYRSQVSEMTGVELIAAERERQVSAEGWSADHDDAHDDNQLAEAAMCYACPPDVDLREDGPPLGWPWEYTWWKPTPDDRIRELVKAGALLAAEIDRLQRATP